MVVSAEPVEPHRTAPPCAPVRPLLCSMWALHALSDRVKLFLLSGGQGPSVSTSASNRAHRNPPTPPHSSTWNSALSRSLHSGPAPNKPLFFLSPSPGTLSVPSSQSLISLSETDFTKRLCPTAFTSSSFYFYLKKTRRPSQPGSRMLGVY